MDLTLVFPFPPSANRYWRKFNNRMVVSDKAKDYRKYVQALAIQQGAIVIPKPAKLGVELRLFRPAKRGDMDNYQKILFDALQGACYENDSQLVEGHIYLADDKRNPRVEVRIWEIGKQHRSPA